MPVVHLPAWLSRLPRSRAPIDDDGGKRRGAMAVACYPDSRKTNTLRLARACQHALRTDGAAFRSRRPRTKGVNYETVSLDTPPGFPKWLSTLSSYLLSMITVRELITHSGPCSSLSVASFALATEPTQGCLIATAACWFAGSTVALPWRDKSAQRFSSTRWFQTLLQRLRSDTTPGA